MENPFREMTCYVLAGGKRGREEHFRKEGPQTRLEKSYRRYATIFERVALVLKEDQAREKYLNFPHVCDDDAAMAPAHGIKAALSEAGSGPVFIGSLDIGEFPLQLIVDLVKSYNGEPFLGYYDPSGDKKNHQPLFGIYSPEMAGKIDEMLAEGECDLRDLMVKQGRLMPLPDDVPAESIGIQ
ncbi:hypothetical protein GF420_10190 [candidate division GN15 bacterium]|nr:hypothetical protein [candidate division GN15 bacterium]